VPGLKVIDRPKAEFFVGSSIQFLLPDFSKAQIGTLLAACLARGVELKWFGAAQPTGFTSRPRLASNLFLGWACAQFA